MTRQIHTFHDILKARKNNKYTIWYSDGIEPNSAAQRLLSNEFFRVGVSPKFKISRSETVFTIGSCFARNIEYRLIQQGISIATKDFRISPDSYVAKASPAAALNKYNTHSIESEILSAFGHYNYENMGLIEAGDGLWWDPLATATKVADFETVKSIRENIQATTKRVAESSLVIMTLGLNEVWQDLQTGVYMNTMPPTPIVRKYQDRFGVVLSDVEDNIDSLERTIATIRKEGPQDTKIVLTVSPVPMGATLSPHDVIAANTYSKSMLRVCAQTIADKYDYVDYFPSYEMIMNSPRHLTWQSDQIHIRDEAVRFVTGYFIEEYFGSADSSV